MREGTRPFSLENGRVTIELGTRFSPSDIAITMQAVLCHEDFAPGFHVLFDARGSEVNPSLQEIKEMLATTHQVAKHFSGRWAVVVSDPLRYGLARMASSLASPLGMKMNAFHSLNEALSWLEEDDDSASK